HSEPPQADDGEVDASLPPGADTPEAAPAPAEAQTPKRPWSEALPDLVAAALVLTGVGWSLASSVYSLLHREQVVALLAASTRDPAHRRRMLLGMFLGAALRPVCAAGYLLFRRSFEAVRQIASWSRVLCPLVLAFI